MAKKKMTQREKAERAKVKKKLQADGILPPDKPRLNRKKFADEVLTEWNEMSPISDDLYLWRAVNCMVGPNMREVTPEQVGVLKVLKIAIELKKFSQRIQEEGRTEYTIGEVMETVILPITRL